MRYQQAVICHAFLDDTSSLYSCPRMFKSQLSCRTQVDKSQANRKTKLLEYLADSILGIIDPRYGEVGKQFQRLHEEIVSRSQKSVDLYVDRNSSAKFAEGELRGFGEWGLLAPLPAYFRCSGNTINDGLRS